MITPPVTKTLEYNGLLCIHDYGEASDCLFLHNQKSPLADILQDEIVNEFVSVRYWITDTKCSKEQAQEQFLKKLYGAADIEFESHYSDITGYLWTDEEIKIGGHDLLAELTSHKDKWLILEIDIHEDKCPR